MLAAQVYHLAPDTLTCRPISLIIYLFINSQSKFTPFHDEILNFLVFPEKFFEPR